jgi:peptide deformylase
MILPIVAYGNSILRKVCNDITNDYTELNGLIHNMWETLYNSSGVGLAAPQINKPIRLFIVDTIQIVKDFNEEDRKKYHDEEHIKKVFINAHIVERTGEQWSYNEGCLSIPKVHEYVSRTKHVRVKYMDENFIQHDEIFSGITARVIQHEYDHIDGKLFIDHISPINKRLIRKKLEDVSKGKVKTAYRMIFIK